MLLSRCRCFSSVLVLAGILALGVPSAWGKNYAFLVACGNYDKKELRPLRYTKNDMVDFYKVLLGSQFSQENIILMHDDQKRDYQPEVKKIKNEFKLLLGVLKKEDTLIVALSGHGVQFKGEEQSFFCPVDAELKDRTTLIGMDDLYKQLNSCPAERKLLVVDACRNDPQSELGKSLTEVSLDSLVAIQKQAVPKGIVALFSCSEGQKSFEDPEIRHSVFFHHILQGWNGAAADPQGHVTLSTLVSYVMEQTPRYARQKLKALQVPQQKNDFSGSWLLRQVNQALIKYGEGLKAAAKKQWEQAIAWYDEAIRLDPNYHPAYFQRGYAYLMKGGNPEQAIADNTQVIRLSPRYALAYNNRGAAYNSQGKTDLAIAEYSAAISIESKNTFYYKNRGWAYLKKKMYPQAIADFTTVTQLDSKYVDAYYGRGMVRHNSGDNDTAILDYTQAIRLNPEHAGAYANRGVCYANKKQYDLALLDYNEGLRLNSKDKWCYKNRGWVYLNKRNYTQALADFERALEIDPKYADAYYGRGSAYANKKQYTQAVAEYTLALRFNPEYADAYQGRGWVHIEKKRYKKAIADLNQAIRYNPKYVIAYNNRGLAYYRKKKYRQAITDYTRAIRLDRKYALAYSNRALAYAAKGKKSKAKSDRKKAKRLARSKKK